MKLAWDKKKIKEENVGSDFPTLCMASVRGTAVTYKGKHLARTHGAHSANICSPVERVPCDTQWHEEARESMCHSAPVACSSALTVAPIEQAPRGG